MSRGRYVESDGVQLIQMGESGENYCLALSKNALLAIREGQSFPIDVLVEGKKRTIVVMRDLTWKMKMKGFQKLNKKAKEAVETKIKMENENAEIGSGIGNKTEN